MIKLLGKIFNPAKKGTIRGEVGRSVRITTQNSRDIIQGFKDVKQADTERRQKGYSFRPDGTREDFIREFRNQRIVVTLYLLLFVFCTSLAALGNYGVMPWMSEFLYVIGLIGLIQYIKWIRDVYRGWKLMSNWKLKDEPVSMSWKQFFHEAIKKPQHLIPISDLLMRGKSHV